MRRSSFCREDIHPDKECAPQVKLRKDAMEAMASYAGMEDRVCPAAVLKKLLFLLHPLSNIKCVHTVKPSIFPRFRQKRQ